MAPELCLDATPVNKLKLKECVDNDENQVIFLNILNFMIILLHNFISFRNLY